MASGGGVAGGVGGAGGAGGGRRWGSSFSPPGSSGPRVSVSGGKRRSRGYDDCEGEDEDENVIGAPYGLGLTGPTIACSSGSECGFCSSVSSVGDAYTVLRPHAPASSSGLLLGDGDRYMRSPPLLSSRRGGGKRPCILPGLGLGVDQEQGHGQDQGQDLCDVEDESSQKFDELYIERGGAGAW